MKAFGKARSGRLRFHSFELDLDTGELQKNGHRIRLQDQPARLLALLASRPGELVTRSEIQKALWEDDRIVEFDTAVNTAIKKVREALDDDPENPRLIETLPRKGYRFIAIVEGTAELIEVIPPPREEAVTPIPAETQLVVASPPEPVTVDVPPPPEPPAPRAAVLSWSWLAFLLGLFLAGIPAVLYFNRPAPPVSPQMHLEVMTPPTADPTSLAISPDGLKIAFVAISEGRSQLRLRSLETWTEQSLAGTDGALFPFWSPNSQSIGFFADGFLKRVDIDGGLPRTLTDAPAGRGGDWNADNIILYTPTTGGPIFQISAMGDAPGTELTKVGASGGSHRHPRFLPDGRHFLYLGEERSIYVGDIRGTDKPKRLVPKVDVAGDYVDKHLLYVKQGTLFAQSFDLSSLTLSGEPFRITDQVHVDAAMSCAALSVSDTGSMIYRTGSGGSQRQFVWYDRNGKELSRVGEPDEGSGVLGPALSSNGQHIAMYRTVDGNSDIWWMALENGIGERFTMDEYPDLNPVWSPDRRRIAFSSNRSNTYDLYVQSIASTETKLLLSTTDPKSASSWSPDGRHLLFRSASRDTSYDIWALPFDDNANPGKAFPVVATKAEEREAEFSPNGNWIAYQSTASGRSEVYIAPFPAVADSIRLALSTNGGAQPRWGSDSELFYIALDGQLMSVRIRYTNNGREVEAEPPVALFATAVGGAVHSNDRQQYVVSPDGDRFLMNTLTEASSPITVILNWKGKS